MKTQNNKLAFNKSAVTELNEKQLVNINGGSIETAIATLFILGLLAGYAVGSK